jgi:fructosamine-3-kinase
MEPEMLEHMLTLGVLTTTGSDIRKCKITQVNGGCINRALVIHSNPPFFVKMNSSANKSLFEAEMEALKTLSATCAIRVPCPLVTGSRGDESFLVLEYLNLREGSKESWQLMGEQIAGLHRHTSPDGRFGWHRNNFIGASPQPNGWHHNWETFWREKRLAFQFNLAAQKGMRFDGSDRLLDNLGSFFAHHEPEPSLLHGDLWSGNVSFTDEGKPVIYDPACYFGDRECDLAFTEMFGGFPREFYEAYDAAWPREGGWRARRDLYNLYHVLNHANLFGGSYESQAQEMIHALNAQR